MARDKYAIGIRPIVPGLSAKDVSNIIGGEYPQ